MGTTTAKNIRTEIKKQLGLSSRQVGVKNHSYSMGSSVYITIKTVEAYKKLEQIEAIAKGNERVHRCPHTLEILSGGNTYVTVSIEQSVKDEMSAPYLEAAQWLINESDKLDDNSGESLDNITLFTNGMNIEVYVNGSSKRSLYRGSHNIESLAWIMAENDNGQIQDNYYEKAYPVVEVSDELSPEEQAIEDEIAGLCDRIEKQTQNIDNELSRIADKLDELNASQVALDVLEGVEHTIEVQSPVEVSQKSSISLEKIPGRGKTRNKVNAPYTTTGGFTFTYC